MKRTSLFYVLLIIPFFIYNCAQAQLKTKVITGLIYMDDGTLTPNQKQYVKLTDSLDNNLKVNPNDTVSLFDRALLYLRYNSLIANPALGNKKALENLVIAKNMAEKAFVLHMQNLNLKIIRAQIYKELIYRFSADESWQFNSKQIADRRSQFNSYKELANKYYDELAILDKRNAYDYQKLKVKGNYPL